MTVLPSCLGFELVTRKISGPLGPGYGCHDGAMRWRARTAFVIADQARMRRDLGLLRPGDEIAVDLRTLTGRRTDLMWDRTRPVSRLRVQLLSRRPVDRLRAGRQAVIPGVYDGCPCIGRR